MTYQQQIAANALLDLADQLPPGAVRQVDGSVLFPNGQMIIPESINNRLPAAFNNPGIANNGISLQNGAACPGVVDQSQLLLTLTAILQQNATLIERVTQSRDHQTHHYNVLPDLSHNISNFNGISGAASARVWIKQLESTATLHNWTETVAFETARSHLEGAAKNWYLANIDEVKDWKTFRKAFSNTFLLEKSLTERFQEMQARVQQHNEHTTEYFFDKLRLCKALGFTLDEIKKPRTVPPYSKPYITNNDKREKIKLKVAEWKENKLVKETVAPYASPCLLVENPDGSTRVVVDYRKLNKNTVRMNFPLPNIDDGLDALFEAEIFAVLDCAQGYLQIPLTDAAKEKTAFITQDETGQFERAMFGLMNAPFYFAKLMKIIFGPYGNQLAITYFDDILVHARSWEELITKIEKVLVLLRDAGLTLNIKKCKFGLD